MFRTLARLFTLDRRVTRLEYLVTALDDVVAQLDTATNEIAAELDQLRGEIANSDQATADRLAPLVQRLQGLAADPSNPVPVDPGTPTA